MVVHVSRVASGENANYKEGHSSDARYRRQRLLHMDEMMQMLSRSQNERRQALEATQLAILLHVTVRMVVAPQHFIKDSEARSKAWTVHTKRQEGHPDFRTAGAFPIQNLAYVSREGSQVNEEKLMSLALKTPPSQQGV